jgi:succinoglycan biosynthesis transport protein ExoP
MADHLVTDSPADPGPEPRSRTASRRPGASVPNMDANDGPDTHLMDYVMVVYKRRRLALTAFVLVVGGVTVYSFTATPVFEARTRLLIEADQQNVVNFKQVVEEDQTKADYYQTQYNILQSRALARGTLEELRLWDKPPFGGGGSESLIRWFAAAPAAVARLVTSSEPAPPPAPDESDAQSKAIDVFLSNLEVTPIRNSRLVDVTYRLPDAALTAAIANTLGKHYIQQSLDYRFTASKEASDWLEGQLAGQRKAVESAEARLQQYREQNDAISMTDRENITVQKLADLNAAVTRAKTERIQKQALYRQLQTSQSDPSRLDTFPAILTNPFVQEQKGQLAALQRQYAEASRRLGAKHPDMIKLTTALEQTQTKLDVEIEKIVQSVRSEYEAAEAQEQSLMAALDQQKGEALSMNRKAIDYGVFARDVESSKQLYNNLLQRAKETGITGELKTSNVRVVDRAERPRRPVSPRKGTNILLSLFVGVILACGLALSFEYLDNRISSPEEFRANLGLVYLGMLPVLPGVDGTYPLLSGGVPAGFSEAFRTLRTNVLFSSAEKGARTLVVTSTGPREGKSLVSGNLAVALAQAGQRVLLIDADLRKPAVHLIFRIGQEPGLSNVMVGSAKASEAVVEPGIEGLWVMAAGRIPPNPAELLGSQRFEELLASLKAHFDWIILDTPPVMAVTDTALVAHHATGVVFVVRADTTSRHAARRALDQLEQVGARFVGGVLNRVDLQRNAYYYSQYYRHEYTQYYTKAS